jgi:hypothetical protein
MLVFELRAEKDCMQSADLIHKETIKMKQDYSSKTSLLSASKAVYGVTFKNCGERMCC